MKQFVAIARGGHYCRIIAAGPLTAELAAYRIYGDCLRHVEEERDIEAFKWVALFSAVAGLATGLFFGISRW